MFPNITIKFEPRDLWIGLFWQYRSSVESPSKWFDLYICIVPMLPIKFHWHWGWKTYGKAYEAYRQESWDLGLGAMDYREWKQHHDLASNKESSVR